MPPLDPLQSPGARSPDLLDRPPPTAAIELSDRPPQGFSDLVPPEPLASVPADQLPEPILRGIVEAGQQITTMVESFVQIAPQFAADFNLVSVALQRALGKILAAGAPAISPTAAGPGFPGGEASRPPSVS